MRKKHGNDGYATWFTVLEHLGKTKYHIIDLRDPFEFEMLAAECDVSGQDFESIIDLMARLGSIDPYLWRFKIIYSPNFVLGIQDAYRQRQNDPKTLPEALQCLGINSEVIRDLPSNHQSDTANNAINSNVNGVNSGENTHTKEKERKKNQSKAKRGVDKDHGFFEDTEILDPYPFEDFWNVYDKEIGADRCREIWAGLDESERAEIMGAVPFYVAARPDKVYRLNPEKYLTQKAYQDEIITKEPANAGGTSKMAGAFALLNQPDQTNTGQPVKPGH